MDKDLEQRKSQLRGRWDQADGYGEEAAAPGEGHCQTTQRTAQALGQSHGGCESTGAKLEGRECVRGAGGGQCAGGGGVDTELPALPQKLGVISMVWPVPGFSQTTFWRRTWVTLIRSPVERQHSFPEIS